MTFLLKYVSDLSGAPVSVTEHNKGFVSARCNLIHPFMDSCRRAKSSTFDDPKTSTPFFGFSNVEHNRRIWSLKLSGKSGCINPIKHETVSGSLA
tara:strand:+ start:144 stop:428 length:285 start_codon:yes stop_codon:yes gene_type:complete